MKATRATALLAALALVAPASGAFLLEIDTDGLDDGVLTLNPNFSTGGDTGVPSQSIAGTAVGLTGGDSVFGGAAANGDGAPNPDTYIYTYTPAVDGDNVGLAPGTVLNEFGDTLVNLPASSGLYEVYVTWPDTGNISFEAPTNYVLSDGVNELLSVSISQDNDSGGFTGNQWISIGQAVLDANTTYTLTQTNTPDEQVGLGGTTFVNGFVSMRASGVLFDRVPEPTSALLAAVALAGFAARRRV
ncbi:PEP-CTERM sorting domain-containing protein [Botrimarina sp.]|uniref:PEP-CTERM sorting domain-containing protein n=1 Tax=Botrimarina sp. TaxID=2795802 RepID=UPI0032ED2588